MQRFVANSACARTDGVPVRMGMLDVAEVAMIEREVFTDPWSVDSFLAEVERKPEIGYPVVVREAGRLVAYAVAWFIVDELHIGNVAVRPECQGRGLATMLLEHLLEEGRRRDMVFATLEVRPSNARAIALYEKFGFRQIARRRNYYRDNREDALVLASALDPSAEARFG